MISRIFRTKIIARIVLAGLFAPVTALAHGGHAHQYASDKRALEATLAENRKQNGQLAATILRSKPSVFNNDHVKPIITRIEWDELQLDDLIQTCGQPETSFGYTGLSWLLIPISDQKEIERRQTIIRSLVEDEKLFNDLQSALLEVRKGETTLLSYWGNSAYGSKYHFYSFLPNYINKRLNNSSLALEGGFWMSGFICTKALLVQLCLGGLEKQFYDTQQKDFNFSKIFTEEFEKAVNVHNPKPKLFVDDNAIRNEDGTINKKALAAIGFFGFGASFGDKVKLHQHLWGTGGLKGKVGSLLGYVAAGSYALGYDVLWGYSMYDAATRFKDLFSSIKQIHTSLVDVAGLIRSLGKVEHVVMQSPELSSLETQKYLRQVMNKKNWSDKLKQLDDILNSYTFNSSWLPSWLSFSSGKILCAHRLMQEVKDELIPALQAIAEFDGYLSIAKLYKKSQDTDNPFTFATFIEGDTPQVDIDGMWTPLIGNTDVVANPVQLGVHNNPTKIVITGPNGGGKSSYLKGLGHAVVMAQSWGIVPAKRARLTLFGGMRTSLDPKEDIIHGISTFMAQKRRIGGIDKFMRSEGNTNKKMLIMLDEPYRGTTDFQTADRVYKFGQAVARIPHAAVCIATHVKKPIELERNSNFANYHIAIKELKDGKFERTFELKPGPARWWFDDKDRASRFVDWLDLQMQKSSLLSNNSLTAYAK